MSERRRYNKWLWGGVILVGLVVAIITGVVLLNRPNDKKEEQKPSETSKVEEPVEAKSEKAAEKTSEEPVAEKEPVVQYAGDNPNESATLTGVVSYAGVSGENLIIRVNIDQFLTSGKCRLVMLRNGATAYEEEVAIEGSVSTSTCKGFVIPAARFESGGYSIEIGLEADGKYGKITREVNI